MKVYIKKNKDGMTLVEIVVALAIFMILVVMVYPIITQAGIINSESSKRQAAEAQGVLLSEYLIYNASNYLDKDSFVNDFLLDKDSFVNDFLKIDILGNDFSAFNCSLIESQYVCDQNSSSPNNFLYEIKFESNNKVNISIKYSKQTYQSVVWLSYRNDVSDDE
jgi:prepilin-type N-terminal cleavage/methylation domain-containing protein